MLDWLGQNEPLPEPSRMLSANACQTLSISGKSEIATAMTTSAPMSTRFGPSRSESEPATKPEHERRRGVDRRREAREAERDPAHVVQVDDQEREDDPVPERVRAARRPGGSRPAAAARGSGCGGTRAREWTVTTRGVRRLRLQRSRSADARNQSRAPARLIGFDVCECCCSDAASCFSHSLPSSMSESHSAPDLLLGSGRLRSQARAARASSSPSTAFAPRTRSRSGARSIRERSTSARRATPSGSRPGRTRCACARSASEGSAGSSR